MPKKFNFPQKVLFKHCDPAGIVFYPRYFEMINDCVEAFFDHIGHPFETMHPDTGVPTASIEVSFKSPSRHGDHIELSLELDRVGRSSVDLAMRCFCQDQLRFSASSTLVYINEHGRPQSWTNALRNAFSPYLRSTE